MGQRIDRNPAHGRRSVIGEPSFEKGQCCVRRFGLRRFVVERFGPIGASSLFSARISRRSRSHSFLVTARTIRDGVFCIIVAPRYDFHQSASAADGRTAR
jgi:hypothetical protein